MGSFGISVAFCIASVITKICFHRPQPTPTIRHDQDTILRFAVVPNLREYYYLLSSVMHILVTLGFPHPPKFICPNPDTLNPTYFTWTGYSISLIVLICTFGVLRISAFYQLDKNFTFELAVPNKLVTDGIYAYIQHPSYLPDGVLTVANVALFQNPDGWPSCFLPADFVRLVVPWSVFTYVCVGTAWAMIISRRIMEEEAMLKATFGKEWIDWHSKTARFIPYVF
jgi:protein-S-isoprenylcysteine O-methyltransferase Ste14